MRKSRRSGFTPKEYTIPINVLDLGDPERDPCFGQLYDLTEDECLSCGDIEWCAVIFNQRVVQKRLAEEAKGSNYDLTVSNLENRKDIVDYYDKQFKSHPSKAVARTMRRFNINEKLIKSIIDGH